MNFPKKYSFIEENNTEDNSEKLDWILFHLVDKVKEDIIKVDKIEKLDKVLGSNNFYKIIFITMKKKGYNDISTKYESIVKIGSHSKEEIEILYVGTYNSIVFRKNLLNSSIEFQNKMLQALELLNQEQIQKINVRGNEKGNVTENLGREYEQFVKSNKEIPMEKIRLRNETPSNKGESWDSFGIEYDKCLGNAFECQVSKYKFNTPSDFVGDNEKSGWLFQSSRNIPQFP